MVLNVTYLTISTYMSKVNQSLYGPEVTQMFKEGKVLRFHDNGTGWW